MQWSPPTTMEDISAWCWMPIAVDAKNRFRHCSNFSTFCMRVELEIGDSLSFFMISGGDRKAALSSSERLAIYFWIAFWNASFCSGLQCTGGSRVWDPLEPTPGSELLDLLWWSGSCSNSRTLFRVSPEDILSWQVNGKNIYSSFSRNTRT